MSTPETRPPRETTNYKWPVPGDADPADLPTALGDPLDAIDTSVFVQGQRATEVANGLRADVDRLQNIPVIEHRVAGHYDLPANPKHGDRVIVRIWDTSFINPVDGWVPEDWQTIVYWELLAVYGFWLVVGGNPLWITSPANVPGWFTGNGTWQWLGPSIMSPFPAMWSRITHGATLTTLVPDSRASVTGGFAPIFAANTNFALPGVIGLDRTLEQTVSLSREFEAWLGVENWETFHFMALAGGWGYIHESRWAAIMPVYIPFQ